MASERLSIFKTLAGAFLIPWWNARLFARSLALPVIGALIVFFAVRALPEEISDGWIGTGLSVAGFALFSALFAVTCHRLVLLPTAHKDQAFQLDAHWRVIRFVLWVVGLSVLEGLISFPFSAAMTWFINTFLIDQGATGNAPPTEELSALSVLLTLSTLPAVYFIARVSLVLPSVTVDRPLSLGTAWVLTKGNGWKMAAIVFLFPWFLFNIVDILPTGSLGEWGWTITIPFSVLVFIIEISALSLSYGQLVGTGAEPNQ